MSQYLFEWYNLIVLNSKRPILSVLKSYKQIGVAKGNPKTLLLQYTRDV
jgi:hypothetical protein